MLKIFVYSHGFGVRKDDRGLFTDIAARFPDIQHIMFDYNEFEGSANVLIAAPLDVQARKLEDALSATSAANPDAELSLICHSQGCISAALMEFVGVRHTIFLAPPAQMLGIEKKDLFLKREGTVQTDDGTISYPRRDGSTTIIKQDYWQSRVGIEPIRLYNALSGRTSLTVIQALNDEVLTNSDFSELKSDIQLIGLEADHDFMGAARPRLLQTLESIV